MSDCTNEFLKAYDPNSIREEMLVETQKLFKSRRINHLEKLTDDAFEDVVGSFALYPLSSMVENDPKKNIAAISGLGGTRKGQFLLKKYKVNIGLDALLSAVPLGIIPFDKSVDSVKFALFFIGVTSFIRAIVDIKTHPIDEKHLVVIQDLHINKVIGGLDKKAVIQRLKTQNSQLFPSESEITNTFDDLVNLRLIKITDNGKIFLVDKIIIGI